MRLFPVSLACLLALAACGGEPAAPTAPVTSASAASAAPSPTPPAPADGENLKACADGTCAVKIRKSMQLAPAPKFEIDQIFLSFEAPKRTEFTVIREIGNIQGYIDGTGYLSLAGTITITIVRVEEDGIVVTFEPKFESKTKDDARGREGLSLYSI